MKTGKHTLRAVLCVTLCVCLCIVSLAANAVSAPESYRTNAEAILCETGRIAVTPGATAGTLHFSWNSAKTTLSEEFRYGKNADMSDAVTVPVQMLTDAAFSANVCRVALTGLAPGTYYYQYTHDGTLSEIAAVTVRDASEGFSVMFCSDPQLGRSGDDSEEAVLDDCYGWERTLNAADARAALSFALCAGDQVNDALSAKQYNALLYPQALRSLPLATAVGNHDFYSPLYAHHFYNPNVREDEVLSTGGNDYYFSYGNTLFMVINSNNYLLEDHKAMMAQAVASHPDALWRVVMLHESMYFAGSDTTNEVVRKLFCPIFEQYDVDLVLSGHEHMYARTGALTGGAADENGVTYLAASCASGSNYSGADSAGSELEYWCVTTEPTYSILDFSDGAILVKSYGTDSGEMFDSFEISKDAPSGTDGGYTMPQWYAHVVEMFVKLLNLIREAVGGFTLIK